jgi:hypothetical protein
MIYYVVQSKWNKEEKYNSFLDSGEVKKALDDFQSNLDQKRTEIQNENFNERLKDLSLHIRIFDIDYIKKDYIEVKYKKMQETLQKNHAFFYIL